MPESVIIFAGNKSTQLNATQGLGSINIGLMLYIPILRMSTVYFLCSVVSFQQSNSTASDGGQDVWIQALCCRYRAEAGLKAEDEIFGQRCRAIFDKVAPQLMADHYDWSIIIEPDIGDYFIYSDPEVAFQKAKQKHPTALLLKMCLNETGTCGRI